MSAKDAPRIRWLIEPTFDDDGVQRSAGIDQFGREHGDPTPLAPPELRSGVDPTYEAIRKVLVTERARFEAMVEAEQFETEAEANDFVCPDELFPPGNEPWEDIHLFPAGGEGRDVALASDAPNGKNRAPVDATSQPSGTVSEGLASEEVRSPPAQTPISGDVGTSGSPGRGAAPGRVGPATSQ